MSSTQNAQIERIVTAEFGLVLIGPPGAGKGTQAARLHDEFELAHIATGDLLREHRVRGTELGRHAAEYMSHGRLVPDQLVVAIVQAAIDDSPRFLLDGFPRTPAQAQALTRVLRQAGRELNAAVLVEAPGDVVIERIAGRQAGRDDDSLETVRRRLEVFDRSTAPVIAYYERIGLLHRIDGSRDIPEVYADAHRLLTELTRETSTS